MTGPLASLGSRRALLRRSRRLDFLYLERWSVFVDLTILAKTLARCDLGPRRVLGSRSGAGLLRAYLGSSEGASEGRPGALRSSAHFLRDRWWRERAILGSWLWSWGFRRGVGQHVQRRLVVTLAGRRCVLRGAASGDRVRAEREELPFDLGSFDAVWAGEVLEHVQDVSRICSPRFTASCAPKQLIVSTPNHGPMKRLQVGLSRRAFETTFDPRSDLRSFSSRKARSAQHFALSHVSSRAGTSRRRKGQHAVNQCHTPN